MTGQHASDAASSAAAFPFPWAVAVWFPAAAMGHIRGEQGCRAVLTLITPGSVWCSVTRVRELQPVPRAREKGAGCSL